MRGCPEPWPENLPSSALVSQPSNTPSTIGRYEVTRVLGQGAMGRVLLARDPVLNRDVAIKILRDDLGLPPEIRDGLIVRMRHEAQAAARVSHPNLVTLHDMGEDETVGLYLVFEYISGPNLKERIRSGRLPPQQAARLARELGNALSIAHLSGVLHRDIKPENILLSPTGAKISDFGIARIPDSTLTRTGSLIGTPAYCAPEALTSGYFSPESDQFSLAATLYEAISGERAFPGDDAVGVAAKIQTEEPRLVARRCNLPDELDEVLLRAMSKNPHGRFASTADLGEVIASVLERQFGPPPPRASLASLPPARASYASQTSHSSIPIEYPPAPPGNGTVRAFLGGLTLLLVGGLVGYIASQGHPFLRMTPDLAPYVSSSASSSSAPSSSTEPPRISPRIRSTVKPIAHPPEPPRLPTIVPSNSAESPIPPASASASASTTVALPSAKPTTSAAPTASAP